MSWTAPIESTLGYVPAASGLLRSTAKQLPTNGSLRPLLWLLVSLLLGAAFLFGGVEAGTILGASMIAVLAFYKPRSGLWASTAFMVYAFVFFQRSPQTGREMPWEFYYWAAGLSLITLGLCVAQPQVRQARSSSARTPQRARFDRAMLLMLLVSLVAALYGLYEGNNFLAVARQLFGCLLLPVYYWLGKSLFRTPEDVDHWLHRASWAVAAGAAWYVAKLGFFTFSEGAYYREQSPLCFFEGAAGAVFFVELLRVPRWGDRIRNAAGFAVCALALVLMGARFPAGSLVATAIVLAVLRWRKRHLAACVLGLVLLAVIIPLGVAEFEGLVEDPGVLGQIAYRFSPFQLDEDASYLGRAAQWQEVADMTRQHPLLGAGLGAEFSYSFLPAAGTPEAYVTTYVDNGWGFVLLKMGTLGLLAFVFLAGTFVLFGLSRHPKSSGTRREAARRGLSAIVLFGLFNFIAGPTFFHFTSSGFLGTALGGLAALAGERSRIDGVSK